MCLSQTDENTDQNMEIISEQQNNFNQHKSIEGYVNVCSAFETTINYAYP